MQNYLLVFTILIKCILMDRIIPPISLEKLVEKKIYSKQDPPLLDLPNEVKIGIFIHRFYAISEQTMDYSLSLNLRQFWNDPRLKFKPPDGSNTTSVRFESAWKKIWIPDTFFRNEKSAGFHSVTVENRQLTVNTEGDIWYTIRLSATLTCPMSLHKYPLDTQTCPILFESFGYTTDTVRLSWLSEPVAVSEGARPLQYTYVGHNLKDCSINYTTETSLPCIQIDLILRRDLGFFAIQVFFPTSLIVILSWVSFWINVDAVPARVSLCLLTVLTMTNLSIGINSNMPKVSYIKAIDVWMSACLLFVFSALCEYAFVNVASRHKPKDKDQKLDFTTCCRIDMPSCWKKDEANLDSSVKTKVMDAKARARRIDKISRKCFPAAFVIFNTIYWIGYASHIV